MKQLIVAAAAALALAPGAGWAKDLPAGGLTLEEMASWLQGEGYKAEIQTADDGSRNIYSAADGQNFHVDTYDCKGDRCALFQLSDVVAGNGRTIGEPAEGRHRTPR
jgi:hypothetical protein